MDFITPLVEKVERTPIIIHRKRFADAIAYFEELLDCSNDATIPVNTARYRTTWDVFRNGDRYIHLSRINLIKLRRQVEYAQDAGHDRVVSSIKLLKQLPVYRKLKSEIRAQLVAE